MSGVGTKRLFARCKAMSGVGGKADLPVERPDFSVLTQSRRPICLFRFGGVTLAMNSPC
jgi:hypothetical protein